MRRRTEEEHQVVQSNQKSVLSPAGFGVIIGVMTFCAGLLYIDPDSNCAIRVNMGINTRPCTTANWRGDVDPTPTPKPIATLAPRVPAQIKK